MAKFEKIGNVYDFGQDEDLSIVVKVNGQAYNVDISATAMLAVNRLSNKIKGLQLLASKKGADAKTSEELNKQAFEMMDEVLKIALGEEQLAEFSKMPMSAATFKKVTQFIMAKVSGQSDEDIAQMVNGDVSKEVKK